MPMHMDRGSRVPVTDHVQVSFANGNAGTGTGTVL